MLPILSIETSTDVCSVALHSADTLLAEAEVHEPQSHAARLVPLIDQILQEAGIQIRNIGAVAISKGPGSYTGLRIGTSTAKGICYALGVPLIAVGTLQLLAFQGNAVNATAGILCPMIDARRMEVYCLLADSALRVLEKPAARIIDETSFSELLTTSRVLFLGNGSQKCKDVIRHPNATFLDDFYPRASALGLMAGEKLRAGEFEDLVDFKPFYLKEFVAGKAPAGI